MKTLSTTLALLAAVVLASCDTHPRFTVEGHIEGAADSLARLIAVTYDAPEQVLDSAKIGSDGTFSFSADAPADPEFYAITIGTRRINFAVDSTETITFSARLDTLERGYDVSGSDEARMMRLTDLAWQRLQDRALAVASDWSLLPRQKTERIDSLETAFRLQVRDSVILRAPQSAAALYAVTLQGLHVALAGAERHLIFDPTGDRHNAKCFAAVATAWQNFHPASPRTAPLCAFAEEAMRATAKPAERILEVDESKIRSTGILSFSLPDADGREHPISEMRGRVTLLDFVRHSDSRSAARTRLLRSLYEKYHAEGFDIYQVSLDEDEHYWKYATAQLPWLSVHDDGTVARLYAVTALPTFFVIDRDNTIVLRSQPDTDLEAEVRRLL